MERSNIEIYVLWLWVTTNFRPSACELTLEMQSSSLKEQIAATHNYGSNYEIHSRIQLMVIYINVPKHSMDDAPRRAPNNSIRFCTIKPKWKHSIYISMECVYLNYKCVSLFLKCKSAL